MKTTSRDMAGALDFLTFATVRRVGAHLVLTDMYGLEIDEVAAVAARRGWVFEPLGPASYRLKASARGGARAGTGRKADSAAGARTQISVRLQPEAYAALERIRTRHGETRSQTIERALALL